LTHTLKAKATAIQESIGNGTFEGVALELLDPFRYIQHNPNVSSGRAAILALHDQLPVDTTRARVVRAFEDGDYGFVHVDYVLGVPVIAFDVHHFRDGRSIEHWDNLQETAASPNRSGRTMIDGETAITDRDRTADNKLLIVRYVEDVLVRGKLDACETYFEGKQLIQHNPHLEDGTDALLACLNEGRRMDAQRGTRYVALHKVLGEGNFVLAICEGFVDGVHCAMYDLYRIQKEKIVEHWDVIEAIPSVTERKNFNGKF